jgi:radical SAM protein with 4Fe4S-binding SPASM domain
MFTNPHSTLEITTMIGCPLMCTYCPQDNLRDAYGKTDDKYMSLETFQHVIDKMPKNVRFDFSGMAEPWVNPDCTDFLRMTLEDGRRVSIYTTLYNISLDEADKIIALLTQYKHLVDVFSIHFPDKNGNMRGWKYSEEWEQVLIKFLEWRNTGAVKFEAMTMSDIGMIHESLQHLGIRLYNWVGHDRAGSLNVDQVKEQSINIAPRHDCSITCSKTEWYDQNVLLPNGDIVLCCMDYDNKHILGNIVEQTYEQIYHGKPIIRLIEVNSRDEFNNESLCKTCTDARRY